VKIDFVIPASPTDGFYSQIAMARLSLNRLGGVYEQAQVRVALGDCEVRETDPGWLPYLDNVHFSWASVEQFRKDSYGATGEHRSNIYRPDADVVIFCDADTLVLRSFDELLERHIEQPAFRGVIAHKPFPERVEDDAGRWRELSRAVLGEEIPLDCNYTLSEGVCPFYVNYGFLMGTPALFDRLKEVHVEVRRKTREYMQSKRTKDFSAQVSVPLAIHRAGTPYESLPIRYNYPNDPVFDARYPEEVPNITILHYLREKHLKRNRVFASSLFFRLFLLKSFSGSNAVFQKRVREITGGNYPFKR